MTSTPTEPQPLIVPRSEHGISRRSIDPDTLKVLYRLQSHGFKAYLVGGGVRDLLLGRQPKDFDVGTDATPAQVRKLFRNAFLVGRRFRLAHVRFGPDKVIEVATFRRQPEAGELPEDPADHFAFRENVFGTPAEDAFRRDFTINALFYDIDSFSVIDHVGGLADLREGRIRVIGDPLVRFMEDPVRMLRALEFAARLGFSLDPPTREAIYARAPLIADAAPSRVREEVLELFRHRVAGQVLRQAQGMGLLAPLLAGYETGEETFALLEELDARRAPGQTVDEGFVLAALFLESFRQLCPAGRETPTPEVIHLAGLVLSPHCDYFHLAHRVRHLARELLLGFFRLQRGPGFRGERRFLRHPLTPLALDLFEPWLASRGQDPALLQRWRALLSGTSSTSGLSGPAPGAEPRPEGQRRKRRRPRRRKPRTASA